MTQWLQGLRDGDAEAARKVWERYCARLVRLGRVRLRGALRRVADEEDVVLSAFDSFLRGCREGRFTQLENRDDLWQVLVLITGRKAVNLRKRMSRLKRGARPTRGDSIDAAEGPSDETRLLHRVLDRDPTPEFAAMFAEECRRLFDPLDDETLRSVARWRLEGYTNAEIAARLGCAERTVERKLWLIRKVWSGES